MKQFNLEEYLKNPLRKVVTRDGRNVKIHCTDYIDKGSGSVIAKIEGNMYSYSFREDGRYVDHKETDNDLFFVTEKHEGWINIFNGVFCDTHASCGIYKSKEAAEKVGNSLSGYITTIKIEWED